MEKCGTVVPQFNFQPKSPKHTENKQLKQHLPPPRGVRDDPCRSAARFLTPPRYAPAPCFASIPAPIRSAQMGRGCARMADALAPCLLVAHRPPLRAAVRPLRSPAPFGRRCPTQAAQLPYPDHHPSFASTPAPLRYAHTGRGCARMADALAPCLLVAHRPPLRAAVRPLRSPAPFGRRCPTQAAQLPYPDHHPSFASIPAPLRYAHTGRGCARMADALAPCLLVGHTRSPRRAIISLSAITIYYRRGFTPLPLACSWRIGRHYGQAGGHSAAPPPSAAVPSAVRPLARPRPPPPLR